MDLQLFGRVEPGDRVEQRQPGADRPLGVVFVRLGISEIDQHAVAHVFGDEPGKAANSLGNDAMIGADHLAQILRIEP